MPTLISIIALELVFLAGTIFHVDYFNGSPYWRWDWRHLNYLRTTFYLALPLIPFVYALYKTQTLKKEEAARKLVIVMMASNGLFQVMGMAAELQPLELLKSIVLSRRATSYFYDAGQINDIFSFLENFHTLDLRAHSSVHPPGPILFYYVMIQLFGADAGAYIGGFAVAIMASLGVLVLYLFSSLWTEDSKTRLTICALYAFLPGLVLFFPQFDQVYPIFSMLLIYYWEMSLRGARRTAIYLGLVLFMATFFAYNLLAIGAFHLLSATVFLFAEANAGRKLRTVVATGITAISTTVLCYFVLFLLTGFNPVLSFGRALVEHARILSVVQRPYGFYLCYNFYEFFLSSGIILMPLLLTFVRKTVGSIKAVDKSVTLTYIGLVSIIVIDLTGLLHSETARLWLFLQPLIMIPVGFELVLLSKPRRWLVFLLLWVNLVVIKTNMWFVIP